MSTQKKLITLCFATVFTLGLAACGGGGGGDAPAPSMMDGDVSLEGKYIPSGTEIRGVDAPNGTTLTAANGVEVTIPGVGTVECASEGGCSGTVEDGVVTITGDLKIVSVDPALDSATVMLLAGLAVDMLPVPGVATGISLDAMAVAGAIGPNADEATVPAALMIANGEPGAMSPLEESDAVDAAAISGWNASVTQRMTEEMGAIKASTDTVIIYNDQDSRARPMFADRHEFDFNTGSEDENDALRIGDGAGDKRRSDQRRGGVPVCSPPDWRGVRREHQLRGHARRGAGHVHVLRGGCTLTTNADGKLVGVSENNWYFIPSEGATVDPNDYLRFGFWLNESTDDEGGPAYTAAAFYGGSADPATASEIQGVVGTASYSGSATGIYMRKTFAENGDPIPQEGGQFTADANLDANFSGGDVSPNALNTVTGMITNFMDGGNAIPGGWALELMKASFASGTYTDNGTFTAMTRRDADTAADGSWTARFFGDSENDPKTDPVIETNLPTGIVGEFTGHFNTGHVLGAFGAEID